MAQPAEGLALLLLWLWLQWWHRFDLWSRNFGMPKAQKKKIKGTNDEKGADGERGYPFLL